MSPLLLVVLILLGVALVQACVWIPLLRVMKKQNAARMGAVEAELAACASRGERTLCTPTLARVRRGHVSGRAIVALTSARVIVQSKSRRDIPLSEVQGVREAASFNGEVRAGARYVILQLGGQEVGLQMRAGDEARWVHAMQGAIASAKG